MDKRDNLTWYSLDIHTLSHPSIHLYTPSIPSYLPTYRGFPRGVLPQEQDLGFGLELLVRQLVVAEALEEVLLLQVLDALLVQPLQLLDGLVVGVACCRVWGGV